MRRAVPGMDAVSRNCQLAPGDHALLQRPHKLDVLDPEVRAQHRAAGARIDRHGPRQHTDGDRAALEAVPQM